MLNVECKELRTAMKLRLHTTIEWTVTKVTVWHGFSDIQIAAMALTSCLQLDLDWKFPKMSSTCLWLKGHQSYQPSKSAYAASRHFKG